MVFQLIAQLRHNAPQFQILRNRGPEWDSVLVYRLCYVQERAMKSNLVKYSSPGPDGPAGIFVPVKFYEETFSKNFCCKLSRFTSYHKNYFFAAKEDDKPNARY